MNGAARLLVGVDLGKTRCRLTISDGVRRLVDVETTGARGLADPCGVEAAHAVVVATGATVPRILGRFSPGGGPLRLPEPATAPVRRLALRTLDRPMAGRTR